MPKNLLRESRLGRCSGLVAFALAVVPAFGSIVSGGSSTNEAAKLLGAGSGSAICHLDILYDDQFEVGSGTLIKVDAKAGKGLILTAAHGFTKFAADPKSIAISFEANPVRKLDRVFATRFSSHPDYDFKTKKGPDLALVEFDLPKHFEIKPMLLPKAEGFKELQKRKEFLFGGYGDYAPNGKETKDFDRTADNGKVRRIGYRVAEYKGRNEAVVPRDSFEGRNVLGSEDAFALATKGKPFEFVGTGHPMFDFPEDFFELVPTYGDSGGPLFHYDAQANQFCLAAVHATNAFVQEWEDNQERKVLVANAVAMTPDALAWVEKAAAGTMKKVTSSFETQAFIRAIYNLGYQLKLSETQILLGQ